MRFSFGALILPVVALQLRVAHGACGDPGAALFGADGNALRAAASCFLLGTKCTTPALLSEMAIPIAPGATTDATAIGNFYGASITDWCTGEVQNFNSVFQNMKVCAVCKRMCLLA